jgi:predicted AlkP superfamily pyrophosphatase or phosphodiesterase
MTFVVICLDGFRQDYLKKTTFLKTLAAENQTGQIDHGFGYASELSAISGKTPEEMGIIASNFAHSNRGIKFFKLFSFLEKSPNKKLRLLLNLIYNLKEFSIGNRQPKSIFNLPLNISDNFEFLLKTNFFSQNSLPFPTIFDILRKKGKNISGYMWPFILRDKNVKIDLLNFKTSTANTDDRAFKKSLKLLEKNPDFCYIHFFSTDNLVHRYGTKSRETENLVHQLDKFVEKLSPHAENLLVFSDHGMTEVKETFNLWKNINESGLVLGKDYIMFLDSTLARFWFKNSRAEKEIKKILLVSNKGKIISFKNKKISEQFGTLIFQVKPGILILPNFYQSNADKATHGYSENSPGEKGFYIFHKNGIKHQEKDIKMKEKFSMILSNI